MNRLRRLLVSWPLLLLAACGSPGPLWGGDRFVTGASKG
jgi:predicted small lipoprotein YifL